MGARDAHHYLGQCHCPRLGTSPVWVLLCPYPNAPVQGHWCRLRFASIPCSHPVFFVPDYQHHTVSLRQLTGKGRTFLWLREHQVEFDKLMSILSSNLVVRHFDQSKPVYLLTDASRLFGLGSALGHMEVDQSGKETFKIVHCGSKGLTAAQQRYSTIELECLVIVWAMLKCSFYLRGLPSFTIYTDHRSLQGVFQRDIFDLASPRLQRLREKIAMFTFQVY